MPAKQNTLLRVALLLAVVAGIFLARRALFRIEPRYRGKPLTAWVGQWESNHWKAYSNPQAKKAAGEAEQAVFAMKEDAIPYLVHLMRQRESVLTKKLRAIVPKSKHARLHLENHLSKDKTTGALGLACLGTNALPALPALIELAYAEMKRTPPDRSDGYLPFFALGFLGPAAQPAIPVMIEALTNRNDNIHLEAAHRLGQLGLRPDLVVPALAAFLESQRNENGNATRDAALNSLMRFGTNAASAGPVVISMLQDRDAVVRQSGTNCLLVIDPALAVRHGVQTGFRQNSQN